MVAVTLAGMPLVVLAADSGIVACEDRCPGRTAALSEGTFDGAVVRSGFGSWPLDTLLVELRRFAVLVEDDVVYVNLTGDESV